MSKSIKHLLIALLIISVAIAYVAAKGFLPQWMGFHLPSDAGDETADLIAENQTLKQVIVELNEQIRRLKKALVGRSVQFAMLQQEIDAPRPSNGLPSLSSLKNMDNELFLNQQIYRALLAEKKRWDAYQQSQYKDILETTLEPVIVESQYLIFQNEASREKFREIESILSLHRQLIRDVRVFHDEIQFRKKQIQGGSDYDLYDLKLELQPFARESAIADALQQALSAVGAGIYQQEASQALERLMGVFVAPIEALTAWLADPDDASEPGPYNYNFYIVFGKKLINYADHLARQTYIPLAPSALGELDYFSRRIGQSLTALNEAGGRANIDPDLLDVQALE